MALAPPAEADLLEARVRAMLVLDPPRARAMARALIVEAHGFGGPERVELLRRRMRALAALPEEQRRTYMALRFAAGREVEVEVDMAEMRAMEEAIASLPPEARGALRRAKEAVLASLGLAFPATTLVSSQGVPYHHDFPMDRHGLRAHRYVCALCGYSLPG